MYIRLYITNNDLGYTPGRVAAVCSHAAMCGMPVASENQTVIEV